MGLPIQVRRSAAVFYRSACCDSNERSFIDQVNEAISTSARAPPPESIGGGGRRQRCGRGRKKKKNANRAGGDSHANRRLAINRPSAAGEDRRRKPARYQRGHCAPVTSAYVSACVCLCVCVCVCVCVFTARWPNKRLCVRFGSPYQLSWRQNICCGTASGDHGHNAVPFRSGGDAFPPFYLIDLYVIMSKRCDCEK